MYSPQAQLNQGAMLPGVQPGTNVVIIPVYAPASSVFTKYKGSLAMKLGIIQILLGISSIVINTLCIVQGVGLSFIGSGIWAAIMYIIAGGFGIGSRNNGRCTVIANMVLSIIATVFAMFPLGFSITGAVIADYGFTDHYDPQVGMALSVILVILTAGEIVTAIVASALCCSGACGGNPVEPQQFLMTVGANNQLVPANPNQPLTRLVMPGPSQPNSGNAAGQAGTPPPQYDEKVPQQ